MKRIDLIGNCLFLGCFIFFASCLGVKPGGVKSGKKLYETFFVGIDGTQYFIKPLLFCNQSTEEIKIDFTFRYKSEIKDSAIVNISFFSKDLFKNNKGFKIINDIDTVAISKMEYLFSERNKKFYISRFSCKISLLDLKNIFQRSNWKLLFLKNDVVDYYSTKATKNKIEKLNYEIFSLF